MAITVNTRQYEWTHGRKPRQPRDYAPGAWAFQIDTQKEPLFIYAKYSDAVKQAKSLAKYAITVLP